MSRSRCATSSEAHGALQQQEPEDPCRGYPLENGHGAGEAADRPPQRQEREEQPPQHGPGEPVDPEPDRGVVAVGILERVDARGDRSDRDEQAVPAERPAVGTQVDVDRPPQVGEGEEQDEAAAANRGEVALLVALDQQRRGADQADEAGEYVDDRDLAVLEYDRAAGRAARTGRRGLSGARRADEPEAVHDQYDDDVEQHDAEQHGLLLASSAPAAGARPPGRGAPRVGPDAACGQWLSIHGGVGWGGGGRGRPVFSDTTAGSWALLCSRSSRPRSGVASTAIPGGVNTRRASPPQLGHAAGASASAMLRVTSKGPHGSHVKA